MKWKEITVKTTNQAFSAVSNLLEEAGASGLFTEKINQARDEVLIKAYFVEDDNLKMKLKRLDDKIKKLKEYGLEIGSIGLEVESLAEEDWATKWKENFKPFHITDDIVIKPTWEEYEVGEDEIMIEMDPGQAFGTGHHVTTSSCLAAIEDNLDEETSLLDLGTGTGILAIAAAKIGAGKILGLDIDQTAVKVARENAELNGVAAKTKFIKGNLVDNVTKDYDLIVANILPHIILDLIPNLERVMQAESRFILSGIVTEKLAAIKECLAENDFVVTDIIKRSEESEEWVTVIGEKDSKEEKQ